MDKKLIRTGEEYALREKGKKDRSVHRVRILQHIRGSKWKAEWIDPNPGLIDYVESQHILIHWKDHRAFLRDEDHQKQIEARSEEQGYQSDSALDNAINVVIESCGDRWISYFKGVLSGQKENFIRFAERSHFSGIEDAQKVYVDRLGRMHAPFE